MWTWARGGGIDGVHLKGHRGMTLDGLFICSGDDCVPSGGGKEHESRWMDVGNLVHRNGVFYNMASGCAMGAGSGYLHNNHLTYENIDVIQARFGICIGTEYKEPCDTARVSHYYYKNIRFEEVRGRLFNANTERGPVTDLFFSNVWAANWGPAQSFLFGTRYFYVENITFDNFRVGDSLLMNDGPIAVNEYVSNIVFSQSDTPIVNVIAEDMYAFEYSHDIGRVVVTRDGSTNEPIPIDLVLRGTARNGEDYELIPASVTIPAGDTTATIEVRPVSDDIPEGIETVEVLLLNKPHSLDFMLGPNHEAVVVINDGPLRASKSSLANGATAVTQTPMFRWTNGGRGRQTLNSFTTPEEFESDQTYDWRTDEIFGQEGSNAQFK